MTYCSLGTINPVSCDAGTYNVTTGSSSCSIIPDGKYVSNQSILNFYSGLNGPYGVVIDGAGNVYVADTFSNAIKKIASNSTNQYTLCPINTYPSAINTSVCI
jgi:streptogramin lyase